MDLVKPKIQYEMQSKACCFQREATDARQSSIFQVLRGLQINKKYAIHEPPEYSRSAQPACLSVKDSTTKYSTIFSQR
jgi:hypothetical protein